MTSQASLELWGGIECTIARVRQDYRNQITETGHGDRPRDIDLIAGLGISTVRYPLLWEAVAPERPDRCDFSWTDDRLAMLKERGIRVIGGLVHHGSGPRYTSLLDPDLPKKLGEYAARVAERYPWIEMWTPVNEPLTTARFSGLYGHWYPHGRKYSTFLRALANQCLGTLEAMQAIRASVPGAQLVQTEDLGKTFSTAPLRYQAAHENERRWLSFDLLCGKVDERHPLIGFVRDAGVGEPALEALGSGKARPDMLGINHYLTSERFLDHRMDLYPGHQVGGNGRERYVDAEAVRVKRLDLKTGVGPRLREAWDRYGIPIAITEVHHGCTREEQLRWFAEVWNVAHEVQAEGVDLRAVTLWSMFGNVDWRSLLTRRDNVYDVGVFDTRSPEPRPTVIAKAAAAYARKEPFNHPVLDLPGWWRRSDRLYSWHGRCKNLGSEGRKLLITGATGTLGRAFGRIAEHRGLPFCLTSRTQLDICDARSIAAALRASRPWAVINTAGFVRVRDAEREQDACFRANTEGAALLARACADAGIPLVTFSSDLVFDGSLGRPYVEDDEPNPACVYGESKALAERQVLETHPQALVIRTSAFFGPWDRYNFAWSVVERLSRGDTVQACPDTQVSPTFVPDLCHATLDLLIDGESGIWHIANPGRLSWHEFACRIADEAGLDSSMIVEKGDGRSSVTALASRRGMLLRSVEQAIADYAAQLPAIGEELVAPLQIAAE